MANPPAPLARSPATIAASGLSTATLSTARALADESHATSTVTAYESSFALFAAWCEAHRATSLPAAPESVAYYVAEMVEAGNAHSTIQKALAAIGHYHGRRGFPNPARDPRVRDMVHGAARTQGTAPRRKVAPLMVADLRAMMGAMGSGAMDARDRALILVQWICALRRSEVSDLLISSVAFEGPVGRRTRCRITVARSKTDQTGQGAVLAFEPGEHPETCPVRALETWMILLASAGVTDGPLFPSMREAGRLMPRTISTKDVARVIKRRAEAAGIDPATVSGHSGRAGHVTQRVLAGDTYEDIARTTRHRSLDSLRGYDRTSGGAVKNTAKKVGL